MKCGPVRLLILLLLALISLPSAAVKPVMLSAGADPWPPYIDESLPKGGVSVQIADAALRTQGFTVVNKILPWARAIEETKIGNIDLILDAWWSQDRSKHFLFSRPYLNGPLKFIKRKGDTFDYKNIVSLSGKSIALVRNYAYGDSFLDAVNYDRHQVHDFLQGMKMLTLGRVDLTLENELVAKTRIRQAAPEMLDLIEWSPMPLSDSFVYLISSYNNPKHVEIIHAFNRGLSIIIKNGVYQKILSENGLPVPNIFPELGKKKR